MLINNFFKRVSIAELLTILFSVSVGISLLYKMGFYNSLGINWYIHNLTPQQLFISSIKLVSISLIGILVGLWLGTKISERQSNLIFIVSTAIIFFITFVGKKIIAVNLYFIIMDWLLMFTLNFIVAMFLINSRALITSKDKSILVNVEPKKINNFDRFERYSVVLMFILGVTSMPYASGSDAGKKVLNNQANLNSVILKDKSSNWLLVEMSGDKVLLKKNTKEAVFKIIEYKEIETISVR